MKIPIAVEKEIRMTLAELREYISTMKDRKLLVLSFEEGKINEA